MSGLINRFFSVERNNYIAMAQQVSMILVELKLLCLTDSYYFIGQLDCCNNVEHICGAADLFSGKINGKNGKNKIGCLK
jgi:hypothetical protein